MPIGISTVLSQTQQLKLSPKMLQTITILAMPVDELSAYIYEEAEKNPALEIIHDANYVSVSSTDSDKHQAFLEQIPSESGETLQENLLFQLAGMQDISPKIRSIAERVINNLDKQGYYIEPCRLLLKEDETEEQLNDAIELIHHFEPAGICCSGIQESLLLQALRDKNAPETAVVILRDFFSLLETPRPALIAKKMLEAAVPVKVSETDVTAALDYIKTLDPFPASQFLSGGGINYVTPDVLVRRSTPDELEDGAPVFTVELLKGNLPEIAVSKELSKMAELSGDASKFAEAPVKNAENFINAVQQRLMTIYKATVGIVKRQQAFFEYGPGHLVPLRMSELAEKLDVHETTVSRIANGKYLRCEWGLFELRYFFTGSVVPKNRKVSQKGDKAVCNVRSSDADSITKDNIKREIARILEENEASGGKRLSDEKLSKKLAELGINVARRTVAKYRSELNIKSSFDR